MGDLEKSAESFHKALGVRRDDVFSTSMLTIVLEHLVGELPPYTGIDLNSCYLNFCKKFARYFKNYFCLTEVNNILGLH